VNVLSLFDGISCGRVALERAGIADTQRYKCIGNGWTVDVIAHILGYLREEINGREYIQNAAKMGL
jgi:site-specific DNA-cytosine methylase